MALSVTPLSVSHSTVMMVDLLSWLAREAASLSLTAPCTPHQSSASQAILLRRDKVAALLD